MTGPMLNHRSSLPLAGVLWLASAVPLPAQEPGLMQRPQVAAALDALRTTNEWTLAQQVSLCEIPAPPFKEATRAAEFRRRLEGLGYRGVRIDPEGNVIAERPGTSRTGPRVVLSAHLDTVFPDTVNVSVRRDGTRLRGPGIGDDCRGLATVLAVARALNEARLQTAGTIVIVATVGEEGPGNLRGVRYLMDRRSAGETDYFISVDGAGLGLVSAAVGSHRYRVTIKGPGGHSYGAFGIPNPIHALGRAIAGIAAIQVPTTPKTTFNVGIIEGGTSINSIAMAGVMEVDMRSESPVALDSLDARVHRAVQQGIEAEHQRWPGTGGRLTVEWKEVGKRPAAVQPDTLSIVRTAIATAGALGFITVPSASSTDANYPMSLGIPAITIDGGGEGGGAHALSEWYDDGREGWKGPQWALMLVLSLAGVPR
ncbi:MAG: peptidase [Gemmatimonadetes bacterium]|nr:peptidase [Gemmatimonadota bacterium]